MGPREFMAARLFAGDLQKHCRENPSCVHSQCQFCTEEHASWLAFIRTSVCRVCLFARHTSAQTTILKTLWPFQESSLQLVYNWSTTGLQLVYNWSTPGLQLVYNWSTLCLEEKTTKEEDGSATTLPPNNEASPPSLTVVRKPSLPERQNSQVNSTIKVDLNMETNKSGMTRALVGLGVFQQCKHDWCAPRLKKQISTESV